MKNQLEKFKINYTRFSAVNGKTINNINEKASKPCTTLLCNHGMIGCALSHIQVLKDFVNDTTNEFMCVMEDDIVIINNNFTTFLQDIPKIYNELPFDIISLFCSGVFCKNLSPSSVITISNYKFSKPTFPLGTVSYIVSKPGAMRLLQELDGQVQYHIDFMIALKHVIGKINYYVLLSPQMITTNDELTSTMGSECNSSVLFLLDKLRCHKIGWFLRIPAFTWNLKYSISLYQIILIIFFLIAIKFRIKWMIVFCVIEFALLTWSLTRI